MAAARRHRLVVIGHGMAAMATVEELLHLAPELYRIEVFGAESHDGYNRVLLSSLLSGEKRLDEIMLHARAWYAERGVCLRLGDPVLAIDRVRKQVRSSQGRQVDYDRLLIATGARPQELDVPGRHLSGVLGFRDLDDVERMREAAGRGGRAVVIGGGLLGVEAAYGLARQGMRVSLLHRGAGLLDQQLDATASALLAGHLLGQGIDLRLGARVCAIDGDDRVEAVRLADGERIEASLAVVAIGIQPRIALAQAAGLHCERGIVVDDSMQSYDPAIYAVGECVQHRRACIGLLAPVRGQARVCADHLARLGHRRYVREPAATRLKVSGIEVFSAGSVAVADDAENLSLRDPHRGIYKRLQLRRNRLVGAVLYGDARDGAWYAELIAQAVDIGHWRNRLLFGRGRCVSPAPSG